MKRYCFLGHVDPANLAKYREAHAAVWPELLRALRDAGWHNYSLHLRDDGLLVGYVESEDLDAAQARVAATDVNRRWQAEMARLFVSEGLPTSRGSSWTRSSTSSRSSPLLIPESPFPHNCGQGRSTRRISGCWGSGHFYVHDGRCRWRRVDVWEGAWLSSRASSCAPGARRWRRGRPAAR